MPSDTAGYPLRTSTNGDKWAALQPLVADVRKMPSMRSAGGKKTPLVCEAHYGGRARKAVVEENPYTKENPCKVRTLGKGPAFMGFYERDECLRRQHRRRARGPRRHVAAGKPVKSGAWTELKPNRT